MNVFKSQSALIAEIHNEFDTAQDRLLAAATKILTTPNAEAVQSISERLQKVGFVNTPTAKKGKEVKKELVSNREQAELIRYYSQTYPFMKFLTEDELNRICEKYKLVHAPVGNYIGEVPEKNITDIERAQELKYQDIEPTRVINKIKWHEYGNSQYYASWSKKSLIKKLELPTVFINMDWRFTSDVDRWVMDNFKTPPEVKWFCDEMTISKVNRKGLFIAAPESNFDLTGLDKNTKHGFFEVFETKVKDPIVFRYVRGGVQVITKWGLEANDPALVVPILN